MDIDLYGYNLITVLIVVLVALQVIKSYVLARLGIDDTNMDRSSSCSDYAAAQSMTTWLGKKIVIINSVLTELAG